MDLSKIKAPHGGTKRTKRRGRGNSSGHGKQSCRGHKGAHSRSGTTTHMAFEGGQMPLIRRMPKVGFNHVENISYQVVNLHKLSVFDKGAVVDAKSLKEHGLVRKDDAPIKILGTGEIDRPLTVKANAFSASAKKKIEQVGGKIESVQRTN